MKINQNTLLSEGLLIKMKCIVKDIFRTTNRIINTITKINKEVRITQSTIATVVIII